MEWLGPSVTEFYDVDSLDTSPKILSTFVDCDMTLWQKIPAVEIFSSRVPIDDAHMARNNGWHGWYDVYSNKSEKSMFNLNFLP